MTWRIPVPIKSTFGRLVRTGGAVLMAVLLIQASPAVSAAQRRENASPSSGADPMALLRSSFDAQHHLSYAGEVETIRFTPRHADVTVVRVEHRQPDMTRRWYIAPQTLFGDSVISRRGKTYEYDEQKHIVFEHEHPWADESLRLSREMLIGKNFRAEFAASGSIAGRRVRCINLIQRSSGRRLSDISIDEQTDLPLARESYHSDGSLAYRMRFTSIRYVDPRRMPLSLFDTPVPAGYQFVQKRLRLVVDTHPGPEMPDVKQPAVLPDGFRLLKSQETILGGVKTKQWIYSDGVRMISLFENEADARPEFGGLKPRRVRFKNTTASIVEKGDDILLTWPTPTGVYTLVGNLTAQELLKLAGQVK